MEDYGNALEEYLKKDGYNFESNLSFILAGLNFDEPLDKKIKKLSGGEKMKILLAAMLLSNDDIFLLDEPTNNLDIEAITWLEKYLKSLNKQMIIVSHDEEFLNNLTTKIIELDGGKIKEYNLSYYAYVEYKELEYTRALEAYENAKEKKSKIKQEINTAQKWASKGMKKKSSDNDKIAANYQKEQTKKTAGKISRLNKELDEVTNHLDIEATKIIEEVIDTFKGTIICITHNRSFKSKLNADLVINM